MYEFFKEGNLFTNACFALEEMKWIEMVEATKKQGWQVSRKTRQKFPVRFPNFTSAFDRPPETPPNPPGVLCGFLFPFLAFFPAASLKPHGRWYLWNLRQGRVEGEGWTAARSLFDMRASGLNMYSPEVVTHKLRKPHSCLYVHWAGPFFGRQAVKQVSWKCSWNLERDRERLSKYR